MTKIAGSSKILQPKRCTPKDVYCHLSLHVAILPSPPTPTSTQASTMTLLGSCGRLGAVGGFGACRVQDVHRL